MFVCGINIPTLCQGDSQDDRVSGELFDYELITCMDETVKELDNDLKSYSALAAANGQIRLNPGHKRNVKVFVQWDRDQYRLGIDLDLTLLPFKNFSKYIKMYKYHESYINKASTLTDTDKPEQLTNNIKCIDWYPTLINFLREITGRNGVPFSYLCITTNVQEKDFYNYFIDEYVDKAPLVGQALTTNTATLHTYIVMFTSGNAVTEANLVAHAAKNNGRFDFMALKYSYGGVGVHAVNALQADKVLNDLFYSGENKPHMWWEKFERQLTYAFNTYGRLNKRIVHSNDMILRMLNRKILADFLQATKASIKLELFKTPVTITYESALAEFRN